ncbi:MAG: DNA cytosine methyltransferase [Bacteroidota bacterium]
MLRAVSLFSNCGAGDYGYREAGFDFKVCAELEPRRADVCSLNHPNAEVIIGDLRESWSEVVSSYKKKFGNKSLDLLTACPPCQGLSSARGKRGFYKDGKSGIKDPRNLLITIVENVVNKLEPKIIVIENVPQFLYRRIIDPDTGQELSAANLIIRRLGKEYDAYPILVDLKDYEVPQYRKRTFITLIRKELECNQVLSKIGSFPFPVPEYGNVDTSKNDEGVTVRSALQALGAPRLSSKTANQSSKTDFHPLHFVSVWERNKYEMIKAIPRFSGKSAWENNRCSNCNHKSENVDVYCTNCGEELKKPITEEANGNRRLIRGFSTSYKRMHSERPASTILTASGHISSHSTIHPYEHRTLSPLECQYLQTFPLDYDWGDTLDKYGPTSIREMIGEAIPPLFTKKHGLILKEIIKGKYPKMISNVDRRIIDAKRNLKK